jgi:ApaG protein
MPITKRSFHQITNGIRVTVQPSFRAEQSRRLQGEFLFSYAVRIENVGSAAATLVSRRWLIHDSIGEDTIVEGEGVVGLQPLIRQGAIHEYESYCVLKSPEGYMEGEYYFERSDGTAFAATIPRFALQSFSGTQRPYPS